MLRGGLSGQGSRGGLGAIDGGLGAFAGTAGRVVLGAGAGQVTETADLVFDDATDFLKVGVAATLKGGVQADASNITLLSIGNVGANVLTPGTGELALWTNNTRRVRIDQNGKVLIGPGGGVEYLSVTPASGRTNISPSGSASDRAWRFTSQSVGAGLKAGPAAGGDTLSSGQRTQLLPDYAGTVGAEIGAAIWNTSSGNANGLWSAASRAGSPILALLEDGGTMTFEGRGAGVVHKLAVAIAHTDFDALGAADLSEVLNLGAALPANSRIVGINIRLATPFTGGGNAVCAVKIGSAGDDDALVATSNLFAAAVDGVVSVLTHGLAPEKFFSASTQLTGTFTADVGLLELDAGAGTIEILYSVLA